MKKTILTFATIQSAFLVWNSAIAANDNFADRLVVTETNVTVTGSNTGATKEPGEPDHAANPGGKSLWWSWTAPANGEVNINTDGSDFDTLLAVYTGSSVSGLSIVATNDDHGLFVTSRVRFQTIQGTPYQIAVDGYNENGVVESGTIKVGLLFVSEPIVRPANDNFGKRIALSGFPVTTNGSNVEATREAEEPVHAGRLGDTSVWWSWTSPVTDTVKISTEGSKFDTVLGVYQGSSITNLAAVASNDDQDPDNHVLTSLAIFESNVGVTYQIAVDGFDGASGQVSLHIDMVNTLLTRPVRLDDGTFQFSVGGLPGRSYQVDATAGFDGWTNLATLTNMTGTVLFVDSQATNFTRRFYRSVLKP